MLTEQEQALVAEAEHASLVAETPYDVGLLRRLAAALRGISDRETAYINSTIQPVLDRLNHAESRLCEVTAERDRLEAQVRADHYRVSLDSGDRGPHVCWTCFEGVDGGGDPSDVSLWPCAVLRTLFLAPATPGGREGA